MARSKTISIVVHGIAVPVKVVREARRNGRVSIGKRTVILRYPDSIFARSEAYYIEWATAWLTEQYAQSPNKFDRFTGHNIGDQITIYGDTYVLDLRGTSAHRGTIHLRGSALHIGIPDDLSPHDAVEMRRRLLSKFAVKRYLSKVEGHVDKINRDLFDNMEVRAVRLKYNRSNWGSCSTRGNINLSTRLLLTPAAAIDYVIIHELAHMIEMNHSERFYEVVRDRCPGYRAQEEWLSANYIDF